MRNKILFITLFLTAFLERVAFDLGSNYELVTAVMIISMIYLGWKKSVSIVFLTLFLSDMIIGNSNIFIFTWTGFLFPSLFAEKLISKKSLTKKLFSGTVAGAASVGFFFLWTNLGVWMTTSMYLKDLSGLIHSYFNALPFLRNQAFSALVFIPLGILLTELIIKFATTNIINKTDCVTCKSRASVIIEEGIRRNS